LTAALAWVPALKWKGALPSRDAPACQSGAEIVVDEQALLEATLNGGCADRVPEVLNVAASVLQHGLRVYL